MERRSGVGVDEVVVVQGGRVGVEGRGKGKKTGHMHEA